MQKRKRPEKTTKLISDGRSGKNKKKSITDEKLLKLWRSAALERAGNRCEFPDCTINYTQLHCHHIYHRAHVSLRYDLRNAIVLCPTHHTLGGLSAHKDPDFKETLILGNVRTRDFFDDLRKERNRVQKNTEDYKLECFEKLKPYLIPF